MKTALYLLAVGLALAAIAMPPVLGDDLALTGDASAIKVSCDKSAEIGTGDPITVEWDGCWVEW